MRRWFTLGLATGLAAASAMSASAQVSSFYLDKWDLTYRFSQNSARVAGFAGIWTPVEDENSEINMWDYGLNVAGFLDDRDAWSGDMWGRSDRLDFSSADGTRSRVSLSEYGLQGSFRSFDRALGLEYGGATLTEDIDRASSTRHSFTTQAVSVIGNQAVGESFVLGASVTIISENESIVSPDPLAVEYEPRRTDYKAGVLYFPTSKIDVGASVTLSSNDFRGYSEDGFHRDKVEWDRPTAELGLQVIYGAETDVQGGAYVRRTLLDGGALLRVSWSREFQTNPSSVDLRLTVPLIDEKIRQTEVGSRWLVRLSEFLTVGADVAYRTGTNVRETDATFSRFLTSIDEESSRVRLSGGLAARASRNLWLMGQVDLDDENQDQLIAAQSQTIDRVARGVRVGGEWFLKPQLAVRFGVTRTTSTEWLTGARNERESVTGSLGLGYAPGGGKLIFDTVLGYGDEDDGLATPGTDGDFFSLLVTGRLLVR